MDEFEAPQERLRVDLATPGAFLPGREIFGTPCAKIVTKKVWRWLSCLHALGFAAA